MKNYIQCNINNLVSKIVGLTIVVMLTLYVLPANAASLNNNSFTVESEIIDANKEQVVAQKKEDTISGKVLDNKGKPLAGAIVVVKGTQNGVITDDSGSFMLKVEGEVVLETSFTGFKGSETKVKAGSDNIVIRLETDVMDTGDVIVSAYGTEQTKESIVGAVSTVRIDDLKSSNSDLTASLAGNVAGIIGWQTGGIPGTLTEEESNTKFYVRGITSFQEGANTEPLILMDGVEISKLDLSRIAPEDIGSFSVLKDAAAAAMYGARGANGVILVTTKKGAPGSVYVSARYDRIYSQPTEVIDVVDPVTYMQRYNEALVGRNSNLLPYYTADRISRTGSTEFPSYVYPANDWFDMMFKPSTINNHYSVNVRGGTDVVQHFTSFTYNDDNGMLNTDSRMSSFDTNISNQNMSFRTNINVNLGDVLFQFNSFTTMDDYYGPYTDVKEAYDLAFRASPVDFAAIYPSTSDDGGFYFGSAEGGFVQTDGGVYKNNPFLELHRGYNLRERHSSLNRFEYIHKLDFITKGLEFRGSVAYQRESYTSDSYVVKPEVMALQSYDQATGIHTLKSLNEDKFSTELSKDINKYDDTSLKRMTYEAKLMYNREFGDHLVSILGVFQTQESVELRKFSELTEEGNIDSETLIVPIFTDTYSRRNLSYAGRFSYGYQNKLFGEVSFAYNGSERFSKEHRMGFFPAVGASYIISKESFMSRYSGWLNMLKFRLSYGLVGNDGVIDDPRYVHLQSIRSVISTPYFLDGSVGYGPNVNPSLYQIYSYANPDIQWEIAETVNFGIDTKLFDMIEINADIYQEIRHNIISYRTSIPASIGMEFEPLDNNGKVRSRGFDISAKFQKSFGNDFWIIMSGTATYNKATFMELEESVNIEPYQSRIGKDISQAFGYVAEGIFSDQKEIDDAPDQPGVVPGDIRYRDMNGDMKIDVNDAVPIGLPETPRLIYGLNGNLYYKGFEFSFSLQGSGQRSFFIDPESVSPFAGDQAMLTAINDSYWSESNMIDDPFWPRLSTSNIIEHNPQEDYYKDGTSTVRKSTFFMYGGAFLRVRQIEFAYSLPKSIINKLNLRSVRVYFRLDNPFLLSSFDVWDIELGEQGFNYPIQKTQSLGISFSF